MPHRSRPTCTPACGPILARPAGNTAEPAAREASSGQFGGVGSDHGARAGGLGGDDQPVQVERAIGSSGSVGGAPRELLEQGSDPVLAQRGPVAATVPRSGSRAARRAPRPDQARNPVLGAATIEAPSELRAARGRTPSSRKPRQPGVISAVRLRAWDAACRAPAGRHYAPAVHGWCHSILIRFGSNPLRPFSVSGRRKSARWRAAGSPLGAAPARAPPSGQRRPARRHAR